MTRLIRGSVLLAACVGLWSCSGDPTADGAGVPTKIVALPAINYITQDTEELIGFSVVDQYGGSVPETWTFTTASPYFTVEMDSTYRVVYNTDGTLSIPDAQTEVRVTVRGVASGVGTITAEAGGLSVDIPVSILPANVPATLSTTTPDIGENVVLTMPAGLILLDDATFSAAGTGDPIVVSRAPDGSSVTLLVAPGTDGPITISGVTPDFADLNLVLNTTESVTATDVSLYFPGTSALGTAPSITMPALGESASFYDIPSGPVMYYKFTVTDTTTTKFTIDWADGGGDIDIAWYTDAGAFLGYFGAGTGAHPEVSTHQYAPGSYIMSPEIYSGGPGAWYKFTVEVVSQP